MSYRVRIEKQVLDFITTLGMDHRRSLKKALKALQNETGDIKALGDELDGFSRLRVGPCRILFRYRPGKVIECVSMNRRPLLCEIFEREVIDKLRGDRP